MKKLLFILLSSISIYGQTTTGKEAKFINGIRNQASQVISDPTNLVTQGTDGTQGIVPATTYKDVLKYATASAMPVTGVVGKFYYTIDNGKYYTWDGTIYQEVSTTQDLQSVLDNGSDAILNSTLDIEGDVNGDNYIIIGANLHPVSYIEINAGLPNYSSFGQIKIHQNELSNKFYSNGNVSGDLTLNSSGASLKGGGTNDGLVELKLGDGFISDTYFKDNRVGISQSGLKYFDDYSANYTSRSLVDKGYTDLNLVHKTDDEIIFDLKTFRDGVVIGNTDIGYANSQLNAGILNNYDVYGNYSSIGATNYEVYTYDNRHLLLDTNTLNFGEIGNETHLLPSTNVDYFGDKYLNMPDISGTLALKSDLAGKQPLATVLTNTTASFTTAQETKLAGIATGATANSSDATLLARANHTGTQTASTISDIQNTITNNTSVLANTAKISFDSTSSTKLGKYPSTATNGKMLQGNGTNYVEVDPPSTPTQGAYTVLANNTASTATPTEQIFKSVAEQTYSGTITWNTTAPTTILNNTFEWQQIGKMVNLRMNISYNTAATNQQVIFTLPSGLPTPSDVTGFTGASNVFAFGSGMMYNDIATLPASAGRYCLLRRNSANNGFEIVVTHGSAISVKSVALTIQYFAQ